MSKRKSNRPAGDLDATRAAAIQAAAAQLGEYFDSVNIVATHKDSMGQTHASVSGSGNWYARYGSTLEWLKCSDIKTFLQLKSEAD